MRIPAPIEPATRAPNNWTRYALCAIAPLLLAACASQGPLTRSQALADYDYLYERAQQIHPRADQPQWHALAMRARAALATGDDTAPQTRLQRAAATLLAGLGDAHTRSDLFRGYYLVRQQQGDPLPITLDWREDGWWLRAAPAELAHALGNEVTGIDGRSLADWYADAAPLISADGEAAKRREFARDVSAYLYMLTGQTEAHRILLQGAAGSTWVDVPRGETTASTPTAAIELRHSPSAPLACLRISSFAHDQVRDRLEAVLPALEAQPGIDLVIDLRGNGGGDAGEALWLLRHLASRPIAIGSKHWRYSRAYRNEMLRHGLRERGLPDRIGLHHLLSLQWFQPVDRSQWQVDGEWLKRDMPPVMPLPHDWHGRLTLLVDGQTYSAAVDLAAWVQDNALGEVLGEETGGHASYASEVVPLRLPNSGLQAQIASAWWWRPAGGDDARGVVPSGPVPADVSTLCRGPL